MILTLAALICAPASGQNMLERLKNRAKNAVENNLGDKVEKGVNDILNGNVGKSPLTRNPILFPATKSSLKIPSSRSSWVSSRPSGTCCPVMPRRVPLRAGRSSPLPMTVRGL